LEYGELATKLKEKVIAVKDIGYTDEHGLKLLVEASEKDIASQELIKEKNVVNKFLETLGKSKTKAVYGEEKVKLAIERGAADLILISKEMGKEKIAQYQTAAEKIGAETVVITTESPEGLQFFNLTRGVGALLRFGLE
jgi:peptide chain release factor subunit 1